jgi:DNA-binding LytR/AlgR family response regulator
MYKIFICDDDRETVSRLETFIIAYAERQSYKITTEVFWSCESLINQLTEGNIPDLIFLDIQFPGMDGVELGTYIRNTMQNEVTGIIYISSLQSYAMQLFQVRPIDFLVKPITTEQLSAVLAKAILLSGRQSKLFTYHKGHENRHVRIADIFYFESRGKEIRLVTQNGEDTFYGTLAAIAPPLEASRFFCPHKSFLVNYYQISIFTYDTLTVTNGDRVPVAQPRRKEVRSIQSRYETEDTI